MRCKATATYRCPSTFIAIAVAVLVLINILSSLNGTHIFVPSLALLLGAGAFMEWRICQRLLFFGLACGAFLFLLANLAIWLAQMPIRGRELEDILTGRVNSIAPLMWTGVALICATGLVWLVAGTRWLLDGVAQSRGRHVWKTSSNSDGTNEEQTNFPPIAELRTSKHVNQVHLVQNANTKHHSCKWVAGAIGVVFLVNIVSSLNGTHIFGHSFVLLLGVGSFMEWRTSQRIVFFGLALGAGAFLLGSASIWTAGMTPYGRELERVLTSRVRPADPRFWVAYVLGITTGVLWFAAGVRWLLDGAERLGRRHEQKTESNAIVQMRDV